MIELNYQNKNLRWGWSGMKFENWASYSKTLGFLSNINHYYKHGNNSSIWNSSIDVRIEKNNLQGAWDKEGRIHYYGDINILRSELEDLFDHSSSGNGHVSCRINSNGYILSLLNNYSFIVREKGDYYTAYIFPPQNAFTSIRFILKKHLVDQNFETTEINLYLNEFDNGWNL